MGKKFHKKPSKKLNFFQNYVHHIHGFDKRFEKQYVRRNQKQQLANLLKDYEHFTFAKLRMFEPLYDGHDYLDEVCGALLLPAVAICMVAVSLVLLVAKLLVEKLSQSSENVPTEDDVMTDYSSNAACLMPLMTFVSLFIFMANSSISLLSRPLVTALKGWKTEDLERFYGDNNRFTGLTA